MPCRFLRQQVRLIVAALVFALFTHRHPRHRVELAAQLLCRAAGEQLAVALGGALRAVELEAQQALAHRILIEQGRGAPPEARALAQLHLRVGERPLAVRAHAMHTRPAAERAPRREKQVEQLFFQTHAVPPFPSRQRRPL